MIDNNSKLRTFYKKDDKYYFIVRYPMLKSNIVQEIFLLHSGFHSYKLFDNGLFIGYMFDFLGRDVTYFDNFLNCNLIDPQLQIESDISAIYLDEHIAIIDKNNSQNILVLGGVQENDNFRR